MEKSLYSYIDPGIIHFMIYPETLEGEGPVLETLKKIALDDFFHAVEVTWIKDDEKRKKAASMLKSSQLEVYYGAQPRLLTQDLDLNSLKEEERKKAVKTIKEGVDEAVELNAEAVAFLSGKDVENAQKEKALDKLVASIEEICDYARSQDQDLGVVLEVFDTDIDKKALVGPAETARKVAERVKENYENFGLMVDLSHLPLLDETPEEALIPVRDHLVHIHIGNCILDKTHPAYGDSHPRFGLESGENDIKELKEFLQTLLDIGYLQKGNPRTVSFEVKPLTGESSEIVIANAKRALRKAWAQL